MPGERSVLIPYPRLPGTPAHLPGTSQLFCAYLSNFPVLPLRHWQSTKYLQEAGGFEELVGRSITDQTNWRLRWNYRQFQDHRFDPVGGNFVKECQMEKQYPYGQ